jgi:hypothetical protein
MPKGTPKGMGSPKAGGGMGVTFPKATSEAPKTPAEAPKGGMGDMAGMSGMKRRDALIEGDECAAEEKRTAKSAKNAHLAYNEDGYYIGKAACFVVSQFKKAGAA